MRLIIQLGTILSAALLAACLGGKGSSGPGAFTPPPPVVNTTTVTVDSGPAAATGAIQSRLCEREGLCSGLSTECATIDHVLLDTGSWGLRLVGSVLAAGNGDAQLPRPTHKDRRSKNAKASAAVKHGGPWRWPTSRWRGKPRPTCPSRSWTTPKPERGRQQGADRHADQRRAGLWRERSAGSRRVRAGLWCRVRERSDASAGVLRLHGRRGMHCRERRARPAGHEPGRPVCGRQQRRHRQSYRI